MEVRRHSVNFVDRCTQSRQGGGGGLRWSRLLYGTIGQRKAGGRETEGESPARGCLVLVVVSAGLLGESVLSLGSFLAVRVFVVRTED